MVGLTTWHVVGRALTSPHQPCRRVVLYQLSIHQPMERAIAAEEYTAADNPMQRRVDEALRRVPERHEPFVGAASRQRPLRRAVRVRVPRRLPRPLTAEDVDALLTSTSSRRDLAIRPLMLDGGLRPGEVLCLRVEDVAYGRRRVTSRKLDDHPRGARAKARRERVVNLHEPRTLDAVSRYVLHERPLDSDSPSVFLVGGSGPRRREPYSYQGLARSFARRLDRLGIQTRRRPRTRCVTPTPQRCGRAGCASLRCSRLGHASPESIRIYPGPRTSRFCRSTGCAARTLMTAATGAATLDVAWPVDRLRHVSRACYQEWVWRHVASSSVRSSRMAA